MELKSVVGMKRWESLVQYLIVSGNPGQDYVYNSILREVLRGAEDGGAQVKILDLEGIGRCKQCDEGSGACRTEHHCAYGSDGFDDAQDMVLDSDAFCLAMPVNLGEAAEYVKNFLERLRRCENNITGTLVGKPLLAIASLDDHGNGLLACLEQVDKFCRQTGAVVFDYIGVSGWNNDYQKISAYSAAKSMAYGRKAGAAN
jgi:multimeric flavodoxin WrbA